MNLVHLIVRQWRQRLARTLLSVASVAIAVAAVLGVMLAQSSVRLAYRELLAVTESSPAVEIIAAEGGRFDPAAIGPLTDVAGVRAATPVVTRATLARVNGERFRAVVLGIPSGDEAIWEALPLVDGVPCRQERQALLSAELARSLNFDVGDRLILLGKRGPHRATIVGLVNAAALAEVAPAATIVMPLNELREMYRLGDTVNRVRVALDPAADRDAVQQAVADRLPDDFVVQAPLAQLELAGGILRSTELALRFAGALSMAMAALIVVNTLRMNFGERRRDMAVLRVLGVTARQLERLLLLEGLLFGLVGAMLGIPLGLVLGRGLAAIMHQLAGAGVPEPQTPYWALLAALIAGPLVAGVAALVPAVQSRGVSPAEALGDTETRRGERFPWWSVAWGAGIWAVAVVLLALVSLERIPTEAAIPAGVCMLVGFIAVIPAVLGPVIRAAARLVSPWTKTEGEIAADQLLERPTRTGLTVGVLVVAISTGIGMGNAIVNNVDDVRGWYRRFTAGDILVAGPSLTEGAAESRDRTDVRQVIAAQAGVEHVIESRFFPARAGGIPTTCIAHEFHPRLILPWAISAAEAERIRARLRQGEAVIGSGLAKRLNIGPGEALRLEVQGRELTFDVAAVVRDYTLGGLAVYIDQPAAAELFELGPANFYTVLTAPKVDIEPLMETLRTLLEQEGLVVESYASLRGQVDLLIGGIVGALWGLLTIGFVIGGVAVANTLSMSVFEQTRELGLLRVIGMTRRQLRKLILCESLLIGVLGALMGTLAGLTTAWIIHLCNEPLLGYSVPFSLHAWLVIANAATCLVITLLAAWLPGERAARLDFLAAISYE